MPPIDEHLFHEISVAGRERHTLPRLSVDGYGEVMKRKEELAGNLSDIASLRDFGGCYLVHGRYLLSPVQQKNLAFASMIDQNPTPEFIATVEKLRSEMPQTEFEVIHGDFRDPSLFVPMRPTDAALLYEVILHQENYVEVMRNVTARTKKYVCIAQPCIREDFFPMPGASVLLQFWNEALKDLFREKSFWPKEPRSERFTSSQWMWGQTTSHLIDIMHGFGWDLRDGVIVDNVCGPCWEYPLLVFARG